MCKQSHARSVASSGYCEKCKKYGQFFIGYGFFLSYYYIRPFEILLGEKQHQKTLGLF